MEEEKKRRWIRKMRDLEIRREKKEERVAPTGVRRKEGMGLLTR